MDSMQNCFMIGASSRSGNPAPGTFANRLQVPGKSPLHGTIRRPALLSPTRCLLVSTLLSADSTSSEMDLVLSSAAENSPGGSANPASHCASTIRLRVKILTADLLPDQADGRQSRPSAVAAPTAGSTSGLHKGRNL